MFTGLVQQLGTVVDRGPHGIAIDIPVLDEALGASIAVDGVCLTVVERSPGTRPGSTRYRFDVLPETLAHTTLGDRAPGDIVNIEPAVRVGDVLGGHWVQGHVDDVAVVVSTEQRTNGQWTDVELALPPDVLRLCAERGSLTVNGVSLTVMGVTATGVQLQLVPETMARTNLATLAVGARVNVEADIVARYVARLTEHLR